MRKKIWCVVALLLLSTFTFFAPPSMATPIDKIIIFGDSLSDNGNVLSLTEKARKVIPLVPLIPKNPPYFNGRFSNGPTWIDNLAHVMDIPLSNYAYGGAWAEPFYDSFQILPFGLGLQVDMYLVAAVTDFEKYKHLYVIWAGGNDYVHGRTDIKYATDNTVANIESQIEWLVYYGGKQFLVLTLPDIGVSPAVRARGPVFAARVTEMTRQHNEKLIAMVEKQRLLHPEVKIIIAYMDALFKDVITQPSKYKLKNITDACYGGGYTLKMQALEEDPAIKAAKDADLDIAKNDALSIPYVNSLLAAKGQQACSNPDEYLFWDKLHPTRIAHEAIANVAFGVLLDNDVRSLSKL